MESQKIEDGMQLPPPQGARHTGRVRWYDQAKRFGFIIPEDESLNAGGDLFVHVSALKLAGLPALSEGQRVEFTLESFRGRAQACNLKLLDGGMA